jgi:hypothetical protein
MKLNNKKHFIRAVFAVVLAVMFFSQSALLADSRFGAPHLGLPVGPLDARSRGMGGVSSALGGECFSFTNPARTINFWRSGFIGSMAQNYTTLDDGTGSYDTRSTNFLGLRAIFPSYYGFVVGFGVRQWRDMSYEYTDTVDVTFLDEPVARNLESVGGLYLSRLSVARNLGDHLALGLGIDWMFGEAERTRTMDFSPAGSFVNSRDAFNDKYSFVRPTLGVFATLGRTNLGFSWSAAADGDQDRDLIYRENNQFSGILVEQSRILEFPSSWRLGVSQRIGSALMVASDLEFEGWADSNVQLDDLVTSGDQWTWCLGIELLPHRSKENPWYRSYPVRAGYSRTTYGYELDGSRVGEQVFSLGAGSYFGRNNGLINVALEYVDRKVDNPVYPTEDVFRVVVSLSLFEKWTKIPRRSQRGE